MPTDHTTMRNELALQKAIRLQLDEIVKLAMHTVAYHINPSMEKNQLRNVVNVAATADSVEVVTNFIRYQIGRNEKQAWRGQHDFGHEVIKAIDGRVADLSRQAVQAMQVELHARGADGTDMPAIDPIRTQTIAHQQLTELYLGYLNRCFYYIKETSDGKNLLRQTVEAPSAKQQ